MNSDSMAAMWIGIRMTPGTKKDGMTGMTLNAALVGMPKGRDE